MPPLHDVESAAATIMVVAAAAIRQAWALRRHHRSMGRRLVSLERELRELRDRFERWSGLP